MAHAFPHTIDDCRREEEALAQLVADDVLKPFPIDESLSRHREICSNILLSDFNLATSSAFRAEDRLWDNHQKVNAKFRAELAKLRKSSEAKPVELRKLSREYLKFIKRSQSFYRSFVKQLDQAYGGIPSLHRIAHKLHSDVPAASGKPPFQQPSAAQLEQCCHRVLIHLGDLSRYRETELADSEKNWGPALGYYDLALSVCPNSGIPFNQRAVIALSDKTLFRALYYVYRSISALEPHPQGEQNLRRTLQKVQQAWSSKELTSDPYASAGSSLPKGMVAWYLRLIEMFFHGKASAEKDELESEVMTQLKFDLQKNPSTESPRKLVLIAIAAQHTAQERFEQNQSNTHQTSYLLFLQLNVKLYSALLSVCVKEAESVPARKPSQRDDAGKGLETSPVLQRLLPCLRLYNLWLEKTSAIIDSPVSGISTTVKIDLWTMYAKTLSFLMSEFPPKSTATISYMLEEDEDTIGFKPLYSNSLRHVWYQNDDLKPRWHELLSENDRDVEQEMAFRAREIVLQGTGFARSKTIPIIVDQETRTFQYNDGQGLNPIRPSEPKSVPKSFFVTTLPPNGDVHESRAHKPLKGRGEEATQDKEAERMVENIVGSANALEVTNANNDLAQSHTWQSNSPIGSTGRRSFGANSPLPMGPHTVGDIMAATYNKPKSVSPQVQNIDMQRSRSGSRPTSSLHSTPIPQQQLRSSSDLSPAIPSQPVRAQYSFPEDPALPGLGIIKSRPVQSTPQTSSPPPWNRPSLPPPPISHSRTNSVEIGRSVWGGGIFDPSYHRGETDPLVGSATEARNDVATSSGRVSNTFQEHPTTSQMLQGVTNSWNDRARGNQQELMTGSSAPDESHNHARTTSNEAWNGLYGRQFTGWNQT